MDIVLEAPNPPVDMLSDYISQQESSFTLHCYDRRFHHATAIDSSGKLIFTVEARKRASLSLRRTVTDSNGKDLFEVRRVGAKGDWSVDDCEKGITLCTVDQRQRFTKPTFIDATVRAGTGEQVVVRMRPNDHAGTIVTVSVGNATIAVIRKAVDNMRAHHPEGEISAWEARVASRVDLSLVSTLSPLP